MKYSLLTLVALIGLSSFVSCEVDVGRYNVFITRGSIRSDAKSFTIRFHNNNNKGKIKNLPYAIALNLEFRFDNDEPTLAMNSFENDSWGDEILQVANLQRNSKYEIMIRIESDKFGIIINNESYEFPFRMNKSNIKRFSYHGDFKWESNTYATWKL